MVSKWLKAFRKASGQAVDPYFETDQQVEQVFTYLRSIMEEALPSLPELDQIRFILEVLLPEVTQCLECCCRLVLELYMRKWHDNNCES